MVDKEIWEAVRDMAGDYAESARRVFRLAVELAEADGVEVCWTDEGVRLDPNRSRSILLVRFDGDFIDYSELFGYCRKYSEFNSEYIELLEKRKAVLDRFLPHPRLVEILEELGFPRV
jgi:hypothetical protein